jgi:predicted nucleotidyltransferase
MQDEEKTGKGESRVTRATDGQQLRAQEAAEKCARVLREQFGVRSVYIFGSVAGQSPWHSESDIDLAVEGLPPDQYMTALSTLWSLLPEGLELDLITLEDAPSGLVARIKGEATMPDEPKAALTQEIADQLASLDRTVDQAKGLLQRLPQPPTFVEINAAGKLVHDFYNGAERIFERIVVRLGPGLPGGPGGYTLLLRGMESAVEGIRPAVVDHALALRLLDYLRFRHIFRHTYGYELEWDRLRPLLQGLEETLSQLRTQLDRVLTAL